MTTTQDQQLEGLGTYKFGWADSDVAGSTAVRGINPGVVENISALKSEPAWMLEMRLKGRRRGAVRVGGRLPLDPRGPRGEGRHLRRHRHRAA
jgi:hypothetical protein